MPFYFCCKCHKLMTTDSQTVPNTFVCAMCKKESSAEVKECGSSPETTDEQNFVICSVSERK
jgi:DNA-directed RNA polymerase subunit M/transcription elongation factor TFIIS